jgi:hypothetical protein
MGEVLTTVSKIMCPHGGQAILTTANAKVSTTRSFWLLETDIHIIAGCPFSIGPVYSPCVRIEWSAGSTRTSVNGTPVLKRESIGKCYSAANALQGIAIIINTQMKVTTQ